MKRLVAVIAAIGVLLLSQSAVATVKVQYTESVRYPYGSFFRDRIPPGLPPETRKASSAGAAYPFIRKIARVIMPFSRDNQAFAETLVILARNESGGTFALPAIPFNLIPRTAKGDPAISTCWGVFQWLQNAWNVVRGDSAAARPWEATPYEELALPIRKYAAIYTGIIEAGGLPYHAAYGVLLWHRGNSYLDEYRASAKQHGNGPAGFDAALLHWHDKWKMRYADHARRIGHHVKCLELLEPLFGLPPTPITL